MLLKMFRGVALEDLEGAIEKGLPPEEVSRRFFEATQNKYGLTVTEKERELARRYGATLTDESDIKKFYEAMRWNLPLHDGNVSLCRLGDTTNAVVQGFVGAGRINCAASATGACRMLTKHPLWAHPLEKDIMVAALPYLRGQELIAFAAVLSMQALMQLSVMLGYRPSEIFDRAVKEYKEEMRIQAAAEEADRQRRSSYGM